jgi:YidC/Oxa1 family membrane protein insertase
LALSRSTTVATGTAATVQNLMKVFIPISVLFSGLIFPLGVLLYWFTSNTWTMLQQLYINKYHPTTPASTPDVGALGKTLAPRPGQRPNRNGPISLNKEPSDQTKDETSDASDSGTAGTNGSAGGGGSGQPPSKAPKPGQRPNQAGGNRPPAKRPNKKRRR